MIISTSVRLCVFSECARRMLFGVRARSCARERQERRRTASARPLDVYHHVGMHMCQCVYMHVCVRVDSMQVCLCVRVCAAGAAHAHDHEMCITTCIHLRMHVSVHVYV